MPRTAIEQQALAKFSVRSDAWHGMLEFRTLAETVPALIFASNADGGHVYTNSAYQRYSGLSFNELLGHGFMKLVHEDDLSGMPERWAAILAKGEPFEAQYRLRRHDGAYRWHVVRGGPVKDAQGNVLRWTGACTDIEDMRVAVEQARDSTELLQSIGNLTGALVMARDDQGRMSFANDAALAVIGHPAEDVIGLRLGLFGGRIDEVANIKDADARVLETGEVHISEGPWTGPDGITRQFRSAKGPWRRANGTVGIVAVTVDVSHEYELQQRLERSEAKFQALVDGLPLLLWMTDRDGKTILQNGLWCDYLGFPSSDEYPVKFDEIVDPDAVQNFAAQWQGCIDTGDLMETEIGLFDRLESKYVPHKITVVPHYLNDGSILGWVGSAIRN
jgi:PAS domain S-box-containing protein